MLLDSVHSRPRCGQDGRSAAVSTARTRGWVLLSDSRRLRRRRDRRSGWSWRARAVYRRSPINRHKATCAECGPAGGIGSTGDWVSRRAAVDFDAFYAERVSAANEQEDDEEDVLVLSADGKGIVMRSEALRQQPRRRRSEPRRSSKPACPKGRSQPQADRRGRRRLRHHARAAHPRLRARSHQREGAALAEGQAQVADRLRGRGRRHRRRGHLRRGAAPRSRPAASLDLSGRRQQPPDRPDQARGQDPQAQIAIVVYVVHVLEYFGRGLVLLSRM